MTGDTGAAVMEEEEFGVGVADYLLGPGNRREERIFDGHARSMLISHSARNERSR